MSPWRCLLWLHRGHACDEGLDGMLSAQRAPVRKASLVVGVPRLLTIQSATALLGQHMPSCILIQAGFLLCGLDVAWQQCFS